MIRPLVIGLGSHHGDDQAGWLIVDRLRELGYPPTHLQRVLQAVDLLDDVQPSQSLLMCDACRGANALGTIHCWQWPTDSLANLRAPTTHDFGLPAVLELARGLKRCPAAVEIWAVEGRNWSPGSLPDDAVCVAARQAAEAIWRKYQDA